MEVDPSVSVRVLRSEYRAACDASSQIVTALGTADAPIAHNGKIHPLVSTTTLPPPCSRG